MSDTPNLPGSGSEPPRKLSGADRAWSDFTLGEWLFAGAVILGIAVLSYVIYRFDLWWNSW